MVDRTAHFQEFVRSIPSSAQRVRKHDSQEKSPFYQGTIRLSEEITILGDQVRLFRLDHARSSITSVSKSGAEISSGAERLKKRFDELENLLKATSESLKNARNVTNQGRQHLERVVVTMEQRLGAIAKEFQESLEKRAKSLADRQERQKNLFGEGVNYRYKTPVPIARTSTPTTTPMSVSQQQQQPPYQQVRGAGNINNGHPSSSFGVGRLPQQQQQQQSNKNGTHELPPPQQQASMQQPFQHPQPQRQANFQQTATTTMAAPNTSAVRHRGPLLVPAFNHSSASSSTYDHSYNESSSSSSYQQQQQQQQVVRRREKLETNRSRLQDVERVERTIGELSQMFVRVASIVKEHEEVINDIESLVDDTQATTNQAQLELLKLFKFISSERGLIIKLLIVTLLLGMMVIYFWT